MSPRVRAILLKCIPYLLSITGGLTIFLVSSREIHDENLNDLINNISASLLSIPLVFLLYDYSNYLVSRRVNKTLATRAVGRVNSIMTAMQATLRHIGGINKNMSLAGFERALVMRRVSFKRSRIAAGDITAFSAARDQLDDIVYSIAQTGALTTAQIQILTDMARELSHIIDQYRLNLRHDRYIRHLDNLLTMMADWYDSVGANNVAAPPARQI